MTDELEREGFDILTEIDVRATLKKKLDEEADERLRRVFDALAGKETL